MLLGGVIGPVMRGPSSSHCAAALRIGRVARDLMGGEIESVHIQLDPDGSLATTHASQGSDMGLFGGLLGWEPSSAQLLARAGIQVEVEIAAFDAPHPNTYRMRLRHPDREHEVVALSTGGGMIEVISIDGIALSIAGDFHETLIGVSGDPAPLVSFLEQRAEADLKRLLAAGVLVLSPLCLSGPALADELKGTRFHVSRLEVIDGSGWSTLDFSC
jgi:L-serine dehydratase